MLLRLFFLDSDRDGAADVKSLTPLSVPRRLNLNISFPVQISPGHDSQLVIGQQSKRRKISNGSSGEPSNQCGLSEGIDIHVSMEEAFKILKHLTSNEQPNASNIGRTVNDNNGTKGRPFAQRQSLQEQIDDSEDDVNTNKNGNKRDNTKANGIRKYETYQSMGLNDSLLNSRK